MKKKGTNTIFLKIHSALTVALTENLHEYKIVERKMTHLFYMDKLYLTLLVYKARKVAVTIFVERKKSEQTLFLKIHSALTIAPTENLHKYKIVERKMAHLFYMGKFYLALLV